MLWLLGELAVALGEAVEAVLAVIVRL